MNASAYRSLVIVASLVIFMLAAASASAGEKVVVQLNDGGVVKGELDERTGDSHVWLRYEGENSTLLRRIPTADVKSVSPAGPGRKAGATKIIAVSVKSGATQAELALMALFGK